MKSITKFAAVVAGMIGACAVMGGCGTDEQGDKKFTKEEFYGVGAVSCVEILASNLNAQATAAFATLATDADGDIKDDAENFNKYFDALNSFLDDSALSVETTENTDEGFTQFATKLTVKGRDISGNATEYILYYNETSVGASGNESKYTLEGVMLTDGVEYRLTGGKEIEIKNGEREEELKIRAYMDGATGDFVEMKQEVSVEGGETETEYVYRIYSDNKLIEETSVEFETETKNGKTETEFELEFRKGDSKGKYKVEREVKNGVTEISVKYNLNGESGKFKIKEIVQDGVPCYEYVFADNTTCTFEKHNGNHGNHDNNHDSNHNNHH